MGNFPKSFQFRHRDRLRPKMVFDIQLLIQSIIYFSAFIAGFAISIPVGVTTIKFNGECILYASFKWERTNHFMMFPSDHVNCNFPVYLSVFGCIFYGLGMGIYNLYALYRSRADPTIGPRMWVLPFIFFNSLVVVAIFISSCIVSVGFSVFCNGLMDEKNKAYKSCGDGENTEWKSMVDGSYFNVGNYYRLMTVGQIASWVAVLIWLLQVACGIIRVVRNRRRERRMYADGQIQSSDIGNIVPTA